MVVDNSGYGKTLENPRKLSKYLMYDFDCNYFKKNFNADFLFTDTGSLTYEVRTDDIYESICKDKEIFIFSNYPKDSITQLARNVLRCVPSRYDKVSNVLGVQGTFRGLLWDQQKN